MRVSISQSNYFPWIGYFSLIARVDTFVFLDSVQFTSRDWRSRNLIKTQHGEHWISIPVSRSATALPICEVQLGSLDWRQLHLETIRRSYTRAVFFKEVFPLIEDLIRLPTSSLALLNQNIVKSVSQFLGLKTRFLVDQDIVPFKDISQMDATDRLVLLSSELDAKVYVTTPRALDYLKVERFSGQGIDLEIFEYPSFPDYSQVWGEFVPNLSIIDVLMNVSKTDVCSWLSR